MAAQFGLILFFIYLILAATNCDALSRPDLIDVFKTAPQPPGRPKLVMPDLSSITSKVPRTDFFFDRNTRQLKAVAELQNILQKIPVKSDLVQMIGQLCDYSELHSAVWLRAVLGTILHRHDRATFRIPKLIEVKPDLVLPSGAMARIQKEMLLPAHKRQCVLVDGSISRDNGPENALWYFREDVMINSHHWFWHLTFPIDAPAKSDRRGELFYAMHHSVIARYHADRLSNGLAPITAYPIQHSRIPEGYHSHLTDLNAKQDWTDRPPFQPLVNVETSFQNFSVDKIKLIRSRILQSIDSGSLLLPNGSHLPLLNVRGIDAVGCIVESNRFSVNPPYYGVLGYHNSGHLLIGNSVHPHNAKDQFPPGVMVDTASAMRDIIFYRWHTEIDEIYIRHKLTLKPYQPVQGELPLSCPGISVDGIQVRSKSSTQTPPNKLSTHWSTAKYDLTNGLDFRRNGSAAQPPISACVKHLNHDDFEYRIQIVNSNKPTKATVRIFLAPRFDPAGARYNMLEQYLRFFALDTFIVDLVRGTNKIVRPSTETPLTISMEQGVDELNFDQSRTSNFCGCGWPHYMLLPKGKPSGMTFDLFVMVTTEAEGSIPALKSTQGRSRGGRSCQESYVFCGGLHGKYPDSKPMGYPFDRLPYSVPVDGTARSRVVQDLDEYVKGSTNMGTVQVQIFHVNHST